jgi:BirA family transcriptional regulator, biotin operon repressor / biotin---[acetyl-CoA-carboxylase] ligase
MILDVEKIKSHCKRHPRVREVAHEFLLFDRVDSTNQIALEMASNGMPGGLVILAESQERGKGRLGRKWFSPEGVNLYLSLFLRPHQPPREFPLFSLATSVAVVEAIEKVTGLSPAIKWPNDILLDHRKVAGILLESETGGGQTPPLVIGIGLNVNLDHSDLPPELQPTAGSLKMALGHEVDRTVLVCTLLETLSEQILLLQEGKADLLIQAMKQKCQTLGKKVRVDTPRQAFEGRAEEIQDDGGLMIRMGDGNLRKILIGDITHLRES